MRLNSKVEGEKLEISFFLSEISESNRGEQRDASETSEIKTRRYETEDENIKREDFFN